MINLNKVLNVELAENMGCKITHFSSSRVSLESKLFDIDLYNSSLTNTLTVNVFDRAIDTHTDFFKAIIGQLINNHKEGKNYKIITLNSAAKLGKGDLMLYNFVSALN